MKYVPRSVEGAWVESLIQVRTEECSVHKLDD